VQEALTSAWRKLAEFDGRAAFGTWLHRIGVNAALEQLRRNRRHQHDGAADATAADDDTPLDALAQQGDESPGPDAQTDGAQIGRRIAEQMEALSGLERAAFVMRHCQGDSLEDIAATLSINIGQSKQAIFRAVRKLRGALQTLR
jgi:RNA polymerase sigma-70 factor (ECF subfamily)